jgi:hypothetical protein
MATFNEVLEHNAQLRAEMLDDIKTWREGGWRLIRSNEDITETWLRDQQARADKLGSVSAPNEKPPAYLYGAF